MHTCYRQETSTILLKVWRNKEHCFFNFQVYNTVLTIITLPYIRSPIFIYFVIGILHSLMDIFTFLPTASPWQPPFYCFCEFCYFRFHAVILHSLWTFGGDLREQFTVCITCFVFLLLTDVYGKMGDGKQYISLLFLS